MENILDSNDENYDQNYDQTAFIILDVWDKPWCKSFLKSRINIIENIDKF